MTLPKDYEFLCPSCGGECDLEAEPEVAGKIPVILFSCRDGECGAQGDASKIALQRHAQRFPTIWGNRSWETEEDS